jgi:hypothetical protein
VRAAQEDRGPYMEAARVLLPPPERERLVHQRLYSAGMFGDENPYLESFAKGNQVTWRVREFPPADRPRGYWLAFSAAITAHLRGIHPTIGWHDRPTPTWVVARPIDAAWVAMWDWVTRGARLRRCQRCREWFAPERRGKVYYSTTCANRATSARAYEEKKRQQRRAKRGRRR